MYQIHFQSPVHVHFIGIGGISMSGLAEVLLEAGFQVSGSDARASELTRQLEEHGAKISCPQSADNVDASIDVVVYTAAIHPDNPEFAAALALGLPMLTRAELLGQLMSNYPASVGIAGTHGKTTTTSMITDILLKTDVDPTVSVGGILDSIGGNIHVGKRDLFVTEACEYTNSFLSLQPTHAVVLNMEADHLDFFKDLDDIRNSFHKYCASVPENGVLVINGEIRELDSFLKGISCKVLTYGLDGDFDYVARDIIYDASGCPSFVIEKRLEGGSYVPLTDVTLQVPGNHNISNALAAAATCDSLHIPAEAIRDGLHVFHGAHRRFEKKGEWNGVTIIDDYAHHPQEIEATLEAAKRVPHNRLLVVFQPHTYSRTKALLPEFGEALSAADEVILADIYAARETDTLGVSSEDIAELIRKAGKPATFLPTFEEIEKFLEKKCFHGDLLITMGAGDVVKVGENLLSK